VSAVGVVVDELERAPVGIFRFVVSTEPAQ
jgi:hypothetical protein